MLSIKGEIGTSRKTIWRVQGTHVQEGLHRCTFQTGDKITSGLSALLGCGGSHGGYGSMMMPAPTVSFSQPAAAATINFGQALTMAWTSAYTTSCTATTSSAAGGAFTAPKC